MKTYDVIVVGAGPAGMTAAIILSKAGMSVLVIEKNKKPGRKLYATGNGRCNLSNDYLDLDCYNSRNEYFPYQIISNDTYKKVNDFLYEIGVPVEAVRDGYYYPVSGQASSVVWAFADAMKKYNTGLALTEKCTDLQYKKSGYRVVTDKDTYFCSKLILACGGPAGTKLGGCRDGIMLGEKLGLISTYIAPSLCRLYVSENISGLCGVRSRAESWLYDKEVLYQHTRGEIQFADGALSGIMIFNLSSQVQDILHKNGSPVIITDFAPDMSDEELKRYICDYFAKFDYRTVNACLNSILSDKLAEYICIRNNINKITACSLSADEKIMTGLISDIKHMSFHVTKTGDMDDCQVTKGGIDTGQINPVNMKVKGSRGLYVIGELLDTDGICGGYNIMWAIATGMKAGESIAGD